MLPTNARERGARRSFKGRKEVAIYPKEAHKIRVRWLLLAQNTSLPTWCFVGVLIQLFVQQLHPVFSVTKLQMIICHAQHSFVCRSTIGIDLLNTTLTILAVKLNAYSKIDEAIYTDLNPLVGLSLSGIPGAHD